VKWIKVVALYLLVIGVYYAILAYIGDFSARQSIVLAFLLSSLSSGLEKAAAKPVKRFTPYSIRVSPKWFELLTDFKLINKPEEWDEIEASFKDTPALEYRILRDGIFLTIVQQSEDFERTLIYWNNHRCFVSDVDFEDHEQRNKFGWKCVTQGPDAEIVIDFPEALEHKYFDVEHRAV